MRNAAPSSATRSHASSARKRSSMGRNARVCVYPSPFILASAPRIPLGPSLTYHLDNDTGEMDAPVFEFPRKAERRMASRGQASRAVLEQEQKNRLFQAEYTSCPAPRDDWFIRVRELEIDGSRNIGTA